MPVRAVASFGWETLAGLTTGNAGNRLFDLSAGTPTINTSTPRTGTACLEISASAGSENVGWDTNTLTTSQNRVWMGFAVRFPTTVPTTQIIAQDSLAAGTGWVFFTDASDQINFGWEGGSTVAGPVLSADTWYYLEVYADHSANPNTLRWWVNGTEQTAPSSLAQAGTTVASVRLGTTNTETWTARFADWAVITDTSAITMPIGKHKVVMVKPDTGGTTTEIGTANATGRMVTNSAVDSTHNSANILAALSEVPVVLGGSASGIGQRTSGTGNACEVPMTTYTLASGETLVTLRAVGIGWAASTTAASMGLRTFNGTTEATLFAAADPNFDNSSTTPAWLCKMATAGHFDTQGELDAFTLRVGYSSDVNPLIGFHALYADVLVKESTGVTGSGVGTFGGLGVSTGTPKVVASNGVGTYGGLGTSNGNPRRLGTSAAGAFGGLGVAVGNPRKLGTSATGDFGGLGTSTGTPSTPAVTGSGVGDFGGLGVAVGTPKVVGSAVGSYGGLGVSTGLPKVLGSNGVGSFGGLGVASGVPRKIGTAAAGLFGWSGLGAGNPRVVGASAAGLWGGLGTATGTTSGIESGSGVGLFGGLGVATGRPTVYGAAVASWGGFGVASGAPKKQGAASGLWGGLGGAQGLARVVGAGIGSWGFTGIATAPPDAIPGHGVAFVGRIGSTAVVLVVGTGFVDVYTDDYGSGFGTAEPGVAYVGRRTGKVVVG